MIYGFHMFSFSFMDPSTLHGWCLKIPHQSMVGDHTFRWQDAVGVAPFVVVPRPEDVANVYTIYIYILHRL